MNQKVRTDILVVGVYCLGEHVTAKTIKTALQTKVGRSNCKQSWCDSPTAYKDETLQPDTILGSFIFRVINFH